MEMGNLKMKVEKGKRYNCWSAALGVRRRSWMLGEIAEVTLGNCFKEQKGQRGKKKKMAFIRNADMK